MNTNDKDIISHKLDQLDTLRGGIVFGREEAWEKLQGRMDNKPARKAGLYYGMAAAVLLLIACVFILLRQPEPQLAMQALSQQPVEKAPAAAQQATTALPATKDVSSTVSKVVRKEHQHFNTSVIEKPEVTRHPPAEPRGVSEEERTPADPIRIASARPMGIVHINELDNEVVTIKSVTPVATEFVPKKLKVVTMSEILRDDYPAMQNDGKRRENSMPLVKALFRQDNYASSGNSTAVRNPLNIKINLQN